MAVVSFMTGALDAAATISRAAGPWSRTKRVEYTDYRFADGALPTGVTLTRAAGPWSRRGESGLLVKGTAADVARFDYDPPQQNLFSNSANGAATFSALVDGVTVTQAAKITKLAFAAHGAGVRSDVHTLDGSATRGPGQVFSVDLRGEVGGEIIELQTLSGSGSPGQKKTVTLTTSFQRFELIQDATAGPYIGIGTDQTTAQAARTVYFQNAQLNRGGVQLPYTETTGAAIDLPAVCKGVLFEPERTNLLPNSEALELYAKDQSGTSAVVTANVAAAPDGTMTAERIDLPALSSGNRATIYGQYSNPSSVTIGAGVFLRGVNGGEVVDLITFSGVFPGISCVLTTGWKFYSFDTVVPAGNVIAFLGHEGRAPSSVATVPAQSFYAWGFQHAYGAGGSYVGPSGTRPAETLTFDVSAGGATGAVLLTYSDGTTETRNGTIAGNVLTLPASATPRVVSSARVQGIPSGVLELGTAADVARFTYGATGSLLGLLVEPQRTNLALQSSNLAAGNWILQGSATRAGSIAGPDGGTTAARITIGTTAGATLQPFNASITASATYALSGYARGATSSPSANVRLTSNNSAAVNTGMSARLALTSAYRQISVTGILSNSSSATIKFGSYDAADAHDAAAQGSFDLFGPQLELIGAGEFAGPTSYIPTTTAAATRAADVLTINWGSKGVADGTWSARFTFDNGTTQDITTTVSGGAASTSGAALNRYTVQKVELFDKPIIMKSGTPTATEVTISTLGFPASGTMEYQVSPRADFAFCVCPIYSSTPSTSLTIGGLNQRCTYFFRFRSRGTNGIAGAWSNVIAIRTADGGAQAIAPAAIMITPAIFVVPEVPISIEGTSTIAGFPAINVLRDAAVGWKATRPDQYSWIDAQFGGQPIDTIAVLNTNLPEACAILIQAAPTFESYAANDGSVVNLYVGAFRASPNLPGRMGYHGIFQFAPTTLPWIRVAFGNGKTANTTYVEHIIFGRNRVTKNHSLDKSETPQPKTSSDRLRTGAPDRVFGLPMRKVDFELQMLTEAQYETVYGDLWQREGEPVFVVPNSKSGGFLHDRMLYGDLQGGRIVNPSSPRYNRQFSILSII